MVPPSVSDATDERFTETAWSVVLAAGAATPARAHTAMAELCRIYWRPIYAYLRRSGHPRHDAEDLTQSFFQHLLENETLQRASRERGRFRSFLLGALKRCLADEHMQQHSLKRGGGGTTHLDGRTRGRGDPSPARRSRSCAGRNPGCSLGGRGAGARARQGPRRMRRGR